MSSPARNLGYAWIPQNTECLEAQPMATTTNVVNLDALIRRADLAAPGEAAEDITSLSVAGLEHADSGDCGQGFRLNATMHSDRRRPPVPTKAAGVWLPA